MSSTARRTTSPPRHAAPHILRNELGLTGPKFGCGLECSACMVIDGLPIDRTTPCRSARSDHHDRGLGSPRNHTRSNKHSSTRRPHNGILLQRNDHGRGAVAQTRADTSRSAPLNGNLCRCGTHMRIIARSGERGIEARWAVRHDDGTQEAAMTSTLSRRVSREHRCPHYRFSLSRRSPQRHRRLPPALQRKPARLRGSSSPPTDQSRSSAARSNLHQRIHGTAPDRRRGARRAVRAHHVGQGDSDRTVDQGSTVGSQSVKRGGAQSRQAAAEARAAPRNGWTPRSAGRLARRRRRRRLGARRHERGRVR